MGGHRPSERIHGDAIPAELRATAHWVCWRWELREGKWTKPPYNPCSGAPAKSTDPTTWGTYGDARLAADRYDGVGFVLAADDPFIGIDLDGCRDPDTAAITDDARAIVDSLTSYTEVSPSGTGLRIIVRGTLPAGGRKHGWVEVYDHARYLTITGAHLEPTPRTIEERSSELATFHAQFFPTVSTGDAPPNTSNGHFRLELDDATLLTKAAAAKNGDKFSRLWRGDLGDVKGDHSAADLQLCGILAFWTGRDASRTDRLFRQSSLMRKKWDERHFSDGRTYGQATISRAVAECRDIYEPRSQTPPTPSVEPVRLVTHSWASLMATTPPPLVYQWPGWVVDKKIMLVAGAGDSFKSWLCTYIALMSAAGRPALESSDDAAPCLAGPVLLISAENGYDEDHRRLHLLARGHSLPLDLPVTLLPADSLSLRDPATWASLIATVAELSPRVVTIDSAISVADLENENDNAEVHAFMKACIIPLARTYGATVYLIVHSPKLPAQKGLVFTDEHLARGASDWRNASDGMLYLKREKTLGDNAIVLRPAKVRIGKRHAPIWFSVQDTEVDAQDNALAVQVTCGGAFSEETGQGEAAALGRAVEAALAVVKGAGRGLPISDVITALGGLKIATSTARRAVAVLRGKHPWPSGLHAGKPLSVVTEGRDGRKKVLQFDGPMIDLGLDSEDEEEPPF